VCLCRIDVILTRLRAYFRLGIVATPKAATGQVLEAKRTKLGKQAFSLRQAAGAKAELRKARPSCVFATGEPPK